ncbi:hypothetical protein QTI51_37175 [Variovorax sp. J22G73]|uniref:hypothetical protein n=1 Tax=unclassified Variovorax TaxID=663243 RepID=UPI0025771E7C|nr:MULTISPECIES: hypothetical protein [unclassified Variovorax]MDM0010179.1 hypothetical protein [Variovorax sp. J22R203]MDM0102959.1 hypothetical protein [Variovorax sp. J22G73]
MHQRIDAAAGSNARAYVIANSGSGDTMNAMVLLGSGPVMLGAHPNGQYLYATTGGDGSVSVYEVD